MGARRLAALHPRLPRTRGGKGAAAALLVAGAIAAQHLAFAASQPTVTALSVAFAAPGSHLTVTGSGFTGATAVTLGGAAVPFAVVDDATIAMTIPASTGPGTGDVVVSVGGTASGVSAADALTVTGPGPVVTSITPGRGVPAGGYTLTVRGTGLAAPGMRTAEVVIGGRHAPTALNGDGSLSVIAPAGAAGPVDLRVITLSPDGSVGQSSAPGTVFVYDPGAPPPTPLPTPVPTPVPTPLPPAGRSHGYRLAGADGSVYSFGMPSIGQVSGPLNQPIVGMASTPDGSGVWLVAQDGGIFPFGSAGGYGSTGGVRLNQPIVGMASTPSGHGYWLVARDGGIFPFGDAGGFGSTGAVRLNQPMVGMAATRTGNGYWLVAGDGGIFPFGDAGGYGSTGGIRLNQPIVGMASTPDGRGYWLVARDGGIFPFGDAGGFGSTGGIRLNQPIVGMASTPTGGGYWLVAGDGGLFPFGAAPGYGSTGGQHIPAPVVGMA